MPAPTWPPDPSQAFLETAREYNVSRQAIGDDTAALSDEEQERSILSAFLFASPEQAALRSVHSEREGLPLYKIERHLGALLRMLSGLDVELAASEPATTDGRRIFLPATLPPPLEAEDESIYRTMGLLQLGLLRFRLLPASILRELYRDWVLRNCFHLLAVRWLLGRWRSEFPGLEQDFSATRLSLKATSPRVNLTEVPRQGMPDAFQVLHQGLVFQVPSMSATARDVLPSSTAIRAIDAAIDHPPDAVLLLLMGQARKLRLHFRESRLGPPPLPWYIGLLRPEWILADLSHDQEALDAWKAGPAPLARLRSAIARSSTPRSGAPPSSEPPAPFSLRRALRKRLEEVVSPPKYLDLARAPAYGALRDEHQQKREPPAAIAPRWSPETDPTELTRHEAGKLPEKDAFFYPEWDSDRRRYHANRVRLQEREAPRGTQQAWERLLSQSGASIREVRRNFESLKLERRWLHAQIDGPELDIDRAIRAWTDHRCGQEPDQRVFQRFQRERKEVALFTLIDLSGSTRGQRIYLEQEALVLVSEGLSALGMPFALAGFHGDAPRSCLLEWLKRFDEPYSIETKLRIGGIEPSGGTRLGAYLRHASFTLSKNRCGRRVLLLLSDGCPEDRDEYRGEQGLQDSQLAVLDARRAGHKVFCVSMDPFEDSPAYLERIFGRGSFLSLKNAEALPRRLPEVVRVLIS